MLLVAYKSEWVTHFELIRSKLLDTLANLSISIEHIGSTAVPELVAKPIIDIDVVYTESADFEHIQKRLESLGYYHNGNQGIEGREVFKRNTRTEDDILDKIAHHLYVCRQDNEELRRHILFRDYIRKHTDARAQYMTLKHEIANEAQQDKKIYAHIKEIKARSFINQIIELAKKDTHQ